MLRAIGRERIGPAVAAFAAEVRREADVRGLAHLYFLARDGWLLQRAYALDAGRGGPRHSYLHLSRRAVFLPDAADVLSLTAAVPTPVAAAALRFPSLTLGKLLELLAAVGPCPPLPAALVPLAAAPFAALRADQRVRGFLGDLATDRAYSEAVTTRRSALRRYLEDEGFFAPGPKALVDVGWSGTIPLLVHHLCAAELSRGDGLHVLYFGRTYGFGTSAPPPGLVLGHGLIFDNRGRGGRPRPPREYSEMIEAMLQPAEGPCLGFAAEASGRVRPVLGTAPAPCAARAVLQEGILASVAAGAPPDATAGARAYASLLTDPTRAEARAIAALFTTSDFAEADGDDLVYARLSRAAFVRRWLRADFPAGRWRAGAVAYHGFSPRFDRALRRLVGALKRALGRHGRHTLGGCIEDDDVGSKREVARASRV